MPGSVKRREFLKAMGAAPAFRASAAARATAGSPPGRPNILLILADDMGYSDLGCYGSEVKTPNIDRLAQNGIRFTHFYNAARCCPSRASLMTGLYPHQAGVGHMLGNWKAPGYTNGLSSHAGAAEAGRIPHHDGRQVASRMERRRLAPGQGI